MIYALSFLIAITFAPLALHADPAGCGALMGIRSQNLDEIAEVRAKLKNSIDQDLQSYCKANRMERFGRKMKLFNETKGDYNQLVDSLQSYDFDKADQFLAKRTFRDTWESSLSGSKAIKLKGLQTTSPLFLNFGFQDMSDVDRWLASPSEEGLKLTNVGPSELVENIPFKTYGISPEKLLKLGGGFACGSVTNGTADCKEALIKNWDHMRPKNLVFPGNYAAISPVEVYNETLKPKYAKGLNAAARKMIERFRGNNVPPKANLESDIRDAFASQGFKGHELEDATWNTLGMLASGGPNLSKRLTKFPSEPFGMENRIALSTMAELIPLMDTAKVESAGSLYSLPNSIRSDCDSGKSYHFWMTAYLARKNAADGMRPKDAAAASYITDAAYMATAVSWRDSEKTLNEPRFGSTETGVRMDLALAASGSAYGAGLTPKNGIDFKNILSESIQNAPIISSQGSWDQTLGKVDPTHNFRGWNSLYQPAAVFNSVVPK